LAECLIRNCVFENNKGAGITAWLSPLNGKSAPLSVKFEKCRVTSDKGGGIYLAGMKEDGPGGWIEFEDCAVENVVSFGAQFGKAADPARIRFRSCSWKNVAQNSNDAPIQLVLNKWVGADKQGGIEFIKCRVEDEKNRPAFEVAGKGTGFTARNLAGTITVKNPPGAVMDLGPLTEEITLKVK
jgi:hypothetical protein